MTRLGECTVAIFALLVVWCGCAPPKPSADSDLEQQREVAVTPPSPSSTAPDGTMPSPAAAEPAPTERVAAEAGVGRRGRSLDQFQKDSVQKIISTPAREYFLARERIVFEIAIPQALNLYKAEHGQGPRTHEEFMRDIVEFNQIELPELQPGSRYVYDPESEQLMVERPARAE